MKFTIRDLLWLMVVAGLALGWWHAYRNSHRLEARQLTALVKALEERRYEVELSQNCVFFGPRGTNPAWSVTVELPE
jgi:hypothetical protein